VAAASAVPATPTEKLDVDFVPAKVSAPPEKAPKLTFKVPGYEQTVPAHSAKESRVKVEIKNWKPGPDDGYVQYILDNKPFRPVMDLNEAVTLGDVNGGADLEEGEHVLVAVPCRPNHESIKVEGAVSVSRFYVGKKKGDTYKSRAPMFVLGSPYGTQTGEKATDALVDFYVLNAELGRSSYAVRTNIKGPGIKADGLQRTIMEWSPYLLMTLHDGTYTVTMELIDKDGNVMPGPWNSTVRTFTVKK